MIDTNDRAKLIRLKLEELLAKAASEKALDLLCIDNQIINCNTSETVRAGLELQHEEMEGRPLVDWVTPEYWSLFKKLNQIEMEDRLAKEEK